MRELEICKLRNAIRTYPWGSRTRLAEFLGRDGPAGEPQAELWMGAHPRAPSEVEIEGRWVSLEGVIRRAPRQILGAAVASRFAATLPFLFKVLAAERALSIQAHPDPRQAELGWRREEALGVPLDAAHRNYRDRSHKPEVLYAVTPFEILRGFRPAAEILDLMRQVGLPELMPEACGALRAGDLAGFFDAYLGLDARRLSEVLARALRSAEQRAPENDAFAWMVKLQRQFPGDRGLLAPLYLHLVVLRPGEAVFTGPGILHAYLEGVGIELMANSDNVVRGGLTSKHVDAGELRRILRFEPAPPRLLGSSTVAGERRFDTVAEELELAVIDIRAGAGYERRAGDSVEILLCAQGQGVIRSTATAAAVVIEKGDSVLVPASDRAYRIEGSGRLFRAGIPDL